MTHHRVVMVDHHFAAPALAHHEERERRRTRGVRTLIAPAAASTTDIYHRGHTESTLLPNFVPRPLTSADLHQWTSRG